MAKKSPHFCVPYKTLLPRKMELRTIARACGSNGEVSRRGGDQLLRKRIFPTSLPTKYAMSMTKDSGRIGPINNRSNKEKSAKLQADFKYRFEVVL